MNGHHLAFFVHNKSLCMIVSPSFLSQVPPPTLVSKLMKNFAAGWKRGPGWEHQNTLPLKCKNSYFYCAWVKTVNIICCPCQDRHVIFHVIVLKAISGTFIEGDCLVFFHSASSSAPAVCSPHRGQDNKLKDSHISIHLRWDTVTFSLSVVRVSS